MSNVRELYFCARAVLYEEEWDAWDLEAAIHAINIERLEAVVALGEAALARGLADGDFDRALMRDEPDEAELDHAAAAFEDADEAYRAALAALGVSHRAEPERPRAVLP